MERTDGEGDRDPIERDGAAAGAGERGRTTGGERGAAASAAVAAKEEGTQCSSGF